MTLLVREHFASPLLQFAEADEGATFDLVECPGELRRKIIPENRVYASEFDAKCLCELSLK
jgi:hypothetical protein